MELNLKQLKLSCKSIPMKVLKFGGTSVGSAHTINQVISILEDQSKSGNVICVVSAVGGITDKLLNAGRLAQAKNKDYNDAFLAIQRSHLKLIDTLIPKKNKEVVKYIEAKLKDLKDLLDGLYLINELSPKTTDKLLSYGELMSSYIITETMKSRSIFAERKNAQQLIVTDSNFDVFEENLPYRLTFQASL